MTGQQLEPRVLVIGLDPYRVPGLWDTEPVADAIEAGMTRFADHDVGARPACWASTAATTTERW